MKLCTKCEKEKPEDQFNKDSSKSDGLYPSCKACYREYYRLIRDQKLKYKQKYRQANKERISEYRVMHYQENRKTQIEQAANWAKKNPLKRRANEAKRRAAKAGSKGRHSAEDAESLYALQKGKCAACKERLGGKYHVDHVIPLAAGGSNGRENIQILCPSCNISKKATDPIEFMQKRGYLL